jgi:hypothetical protein
MALIETPANNNGLKINYIEQIDCSMKSISRVIAWTHDDDEGDEG